jgi:hypothetical protein
MYIYIYICIYTYICIYIHICLNTFTHIYIYVYAYICMYIFICVRIVIFLHAHIYVNLHIFQPTKQDANCPKSSVGPRAYSRNHNSMRYSWKGDAHNLKLIRVSRASGACVTKIFELESWTAGSLCLFRSNRKPVQKLSIIVLVRFRANCCVFWIRNCMAPRLRKGASMRTQWASSAFARVLKPCSIEIGSL